MSRDLKAVIPQLDIHGPQILLAGPCAIESEAHGEDN